MKEDKKEKLKFGVFYVLFIQVLCHFVIWTVTGSVFLILGFTFLEFPNFNFNVFWSIERFTLALGIASSIAIPIMDKMEKSKYY